MNMYVGLDIGSCTTKAVVIDDNAKMVGRHVCRSGIDYQKSAINIGYVGVNFRF